MHDLHIGCYSCLTTNGVAMSSSYSVYYRYRLQFLTVLLMSVVLVWLSEV